MGEMDHARANMVLRRAGWSRDEILDTQPALRLRVARALLNLESRLAEVERERDAYRDAAAATTLPRYGIRWRGPTEPISEPMPDGYWTPWHLAAASLTRIETAAKKAERVAESWDCSESWEDDGDCIDNDAEAEACLRCHVVATLRSALEGGGDA